VFLSCLAAVFLLQSPPPPAAKPTAVPSPAPALQGTVKGPDSKPIADALVVARSLAMGGLPVLARTDASGRFQLKLAKPLLQFVRVDAHGFAGRSIEKAAPGVPLDIRLALGVSLEGTVRDGTTGQPVAEAIVDAHAETSAPPPWEPSAGIASATSDAKGHFRLEGLSPGNQTVRAHARNVGAGRSRAVSGRVVDVYLFPSATVGGTVAGPGTVPVRGAIVRAEKAGPRSGTASLAVTTDAQGRYEIAGLDPGVYRIVARHPDFAPGLVPSLTVERGNDLRANLVLQKGAAVVGRLVAGPEGERIPVAGRVALQELDGESAPPSLRDVMQVDAAADGHFRLDGLPPGSHALAAIAPGYVSQRVEVEVGPRSTDVDLGDVGLERGLSIRGRVRDRAGAPVAGAGVLGSAARRMPSRTIQAVTEADGTFVLAGLEAGLQRISVFANGYVPENREAETGASGVEVILSPGGSIVGTVVDETGREVETFQISAEPATDDTPSARMRATSRSREVSSADGRFTLDDLAEGTYVLGASAADRATTHVSGIKVSAGSTTDAGRIRLAAGGIVRGSVVDAASAPVPGAVVRAQGAGTNQFSGKGNQAVTDPSGAFELRGVSPGTVEMIAVHPSYSEGRVGGVEVDPAKGPAEVRIVLMQGGRLEGSVRRRDGAPIAGANLSVVRPRPGGYYLNSDEPSMLSTGGDGAFVVEHLPAGPVEVALLNRAGSLFTSSQIKEVDVREGETTPVEFRARDILISGHVTRAGAPLAGARLSLRRGGMMFMSFSPNAPEDVPAVAPGPSRMSAVTGEDGAYEMIAEEAGKVYVVTESADGRVSYPGRSIDVPDADTFTLDLAFATSTVSGVVLDQETQKPIARAQVSASPKDPKAPAGSSGRTGDDGRFQLELEPGDYRVRASADDYGSTTAEASVGADGGGDLTLTLGRGLPLSGTVVDARGHGIGGLQVLANPSGGQGGTGYAMSRQDGTFSMSGLTAGGYSVTTHTDLGAFARTVSVKGGDKDIVLTLRPGGRVTVRVVGGDGQPIAGAQVFDIQGSTYASTDAGGIAELAVPAGKSDMRASKDRLDGAVPVEVGEGGVLVIDLKLEPPPPGAR
jgi:protocatechuate 3,4-dioxygenase beta subunit